MARHYRDVSVSRSLAIDTSPSARDRRILHGGRVSSKRVYQDEDRGDSCGRSYPSPPSSARSGSSSPRSSLNSNPSLTNAAASSSRSSTTGGQNFDRAANQIPRSQPSIKVSSLLADPQTRIYRLEVVQQPLCTAEFGMANLSRLPVTPPVVAKLTISDPTGNPVVPEGELPFLIAHLSLHSEDGQRSLDQGSQIGRENQAPILYGNLVSSVEHLEDLQGNMGLFFLFPDVSVRWTGRYQLGVTLSRISNSDASGVHNIAEAGTHLCHARTSVFDVVPLNQYTAAPATRLTQAFVRQGARMFSLLSGSGP